MDTIQTPRLAPTTSLPPFDASAMETKRGGFWDVVYSSPRLLRLGYTLAQWAAPITHMHFVYRYDEVREALSHDRELPVGWGDRMVEVTSGEGCPGKNFVLGMARGDEYRHDYQELAEAFAPTHVPLYIAKPAEEQTREILGTLLGRQANEDGRVRFDAVQDIIHAVPTRLTGRYYGIPIDDESAFAKWTLAASSYVFGVKEDRKLTDRERRLGLGGSAHLRAAIRAGIQRADAEIAQGVSSPYTVIRHLRSLGVAERQVLAQIFGMVLGFIPTNVLAGGNMLETLLRNPGFLERARMAALAGDDDLVWRSIREALRFRNINPGMWRTCPEGYTFADGRVIPPGIRRVVVSAQTAMFDAARVRRAQVFDPDRDDADYMIFGVGQHWCLGAYMARAQLTQTFKQLLLLDDLRAVDSRVRTARFADIFPMHLDVTVRKSGTARAAP